MLSTIQLRSNGVNYFQGGGPFLRQGNVFSSPLPIDQSTYYTPGTGRPAISTADYYHMDGLYWFRCYDLQNNFGTAGQSISSSTGYRYVWMVCPDHPALEVFGWGIDAVTIKLGYSNDPGILPDPSTLQQTFPSFITSGGVRYQAPHNAYLFYNPDDASYPFWISSQDDDLDGPIADALEGVMWKSPDLSAGSWVFAGVSHPCTAWSGLTAFQHPIRLSSNSWISFGAYDPMDNQGHVGKWSASSPGSTWTQVAPYINVDGRGGAWQLHQSSDPITISSQQYTIGNGNVSGEVGNRVFLVPIKGDNSGSVDQSVSPSLFTPISNYYGQTYPGPTFMNDIGSYLEDGILTAYAQHGYFNGLNETFVDVYTYITDASAAVNAAPIGVSASCSAGVVTLQWFDALPLKTYRVYRGTSSGTQATLIGDFTGTVATDTPTPGSRYWYKVVALNGGEKGNRVVNVYASNASATTNKHINRSLAAGASSSTIDATWIESVVSWLISQNLINNLLFWTDPSFGCKLSGSVIQREFDLGCTALPRGGDYTPSTSNTTYSASTFGSNGVPCEINSTTSAYGYYGGGLPRLAHIRRKNQITVISALSKAGGDLATPLSYRVQFSNPGFYLQATSGGNASFTFGDSSHQVTATKVLTASTVQIIGGSYDGVNVKAWVEGVEGSSQTGIADNKTLLGTQVFGGAYSMLGSGSRGIQFNQAVTQLAKDGTFTFTDVEAKFTCGSRIVFDIALNSAQWLSLISLLRSRIGT